MNTMIKNESSTSLKDNDYKSNLILLIKKERLEEIRRDSVCFFNEYRENKQTFDFNITEIEDKGDFVNLHIGLIFEIDFIADLYRDIHLEVNANINQVEKLKGMIDKSCINHRILDMRIDDLVARNEELENQLKILKMQIYTELSKNEKLLKDFSEHMKIYGCDCSLTYKAFAYEVEKELYELFKYTCEGHMIELLPYEYEIIE